MLRRRKEKYREEIATTIKSEQVPTRINYESAVGSDIESELDVEGDLLP